MFECYEDFEKFIAERLATLRSMKSISARDMSLTMGQGQGYINNIENNNNLPSMRGFYYICEILNVSPKDFFDDETDDPEALNALLQDLRKLNSEQLGNVRAIVKDLIK